MLFSTGSYILGEVTKNPVQLKLQAYKYIDKDKLVTMKIFGFPVKYGDQEIRILKWEKYKEISFNGHI